MAPYQYKPLELDLQEIRLVHLLPGRLEDSVKFRILHAPFPLPAKAPPKAHNFQVDTFRTLISYPWDIEELENGDLVIFNVVTGQTDLLQPAAPSLEEAPEYQPRYEALSYTWGYADISELAQVRDDHNSDESYTTLGLRPNLASALRYLRSPTETRILWIDAICINQEDTEERNEQVKRMTNIYTQAQRVIAWLGEESSNSQHALTTLQHTGKQLEVTTSGRVIASLGATEPSLWRNDHVPSFDEQTWRALIDFMEREWFYRLWCWQEIKLGSSDALIQCGGDTMPWKHFWRAVLCIHNKEILPSIRFRERCRHIVFLQYTVSGQSVSNILDLSRSKGCVNPRDKIYGLLGITPTYFSSNIKVDYSRPVQDVYKEAFLTHLNMTKRLELLKHCDLGGRQTEGPSWVPDWSKTEFAAPILSEQLSTGISRAWYTFIDPNILEVVGKRYTTITTVTEVAPKNEKETLLAIKGWFQQLPNDFYYTTGETMGEALALTISMNRTRERHPYSHFLSTSEWDGVLRQILSLDSNSLDHPIYAERETANTIQKVRGRRMFVTESGHIGTAPAGAQAGDIICLILGTYAPMVLRSDSSGHYQVVGECYVHGLSDSVGLLGPLPDRWKTIIKGDSLGRPTQIFIDLRDRREYLEDPRLDPLPSHWERAEYERSADDPSIFERFRNLKTGELVNHDPRLYPDALEARGIELETFRLV